MKFSLKSFDDLGRCSYGTLLKEFDTDRDKIYLNDKEVKIESIDDLLPFLWSIPGGSGYSPEGSSASFFSVDGVVRPHWHQDYDESVNVSNPREFEKLLKKYIATDPENALRRGKIATQALDLAEHNDKLKSILSRLDKQMEDLKKSLRSENESKND